MRVTAPAAPAPDVPEASEEAVRLELEKLRARGLIAQVAEAFAEGTPPRRALTSLSESFGMQLGAAAFAYLALAVSFKLLVPPEQEAYKGLNFFLYLFLLGSAIHFGRYDLARTVFSSVVLVGVAVLAYAVHLTGFRPSLYFLVSQPILGMLANLMVGPVLEAAAARTVVAELTRRELFDAKDRTKSAGGADEEVLRRMREAELKAVQSRTQFSDLLNQLRDLGGAHRESDIFETMFRLLQKGCGAEAAEVWFVDEAKGELHVEEARVAGGRGMTPTDFKAKVAYDDTSLVGYCAKHGAALLPEKLESDGVLREVRRKSPHPTLFCFPIVAEGKVRAVVNVSKGPKALDSHQAALLNTVCQVATKAFESASTFQLSETERKAAVNLSEAERKERIKTRQTLERFVSANLVDQIMENPKLSQSMEVTVLLADLRGFTALSEKLPPETVVAMLNDYFSCLTPLVFKYGGILDKYIGDMVMSLFGPPRPTGRDTEMAVRCALEMRRAFDTQFKPKWEARVGEVLDMGIALNTGRATVGLLGSQRQVNYTAIGDAVNTASRLEDATPGGRILVTEATYQQVAAVVEAKLVGAKAFKGKTEKTQIFEIRGLKGAAPAAGSGTERRTVGPAPGPVAAVSEGSPVIRPQNSGMRLHTVTASTVPGPDRPSGPWVAAGAGAGAGGTPGPVPAANVRTAPCPLCRAPVPLGAQICPTCGMKV